MIETEAVEAAEKVERLEERLADLRDRRNQLTDRADEIRKEIRELKAEAADAIGSGDLEALADETPEARIEALGKEARRIRQSVDRLKRQIRTSEIQRDRTIGSALEYFDGLLAEEEAELEAEREALLPAYRTYAKNHRALTAKKRRLVHCHNEWRQPGSNILGRKASDIPEPLEVGGGEAPDSSALEGDLPHIRPKTFVYEKPQQVKRVHVARGA